MAALLLPALSSRSLTKALSPGWVQAVCDASTHGKDPTGPLISSSPNSWQIVLRTSKAATWAPSQGVYPSDSTLHPCHYGLSTWAMTGTHTLYHLCPSVTTSLQKQRGSSAYPIEFSTLHSKVGVPNNAKKVLLAIGAPGAAICSKRLQLSETTRL